MAEIISGESHNKKNAGVKKLKKVSTRIDLTPMVDLGFLLITFFIFTTTMSQPKAMKLILPDDTDAKMPTKESGALTLLLGSNSSIYYYEGNLVKGGSNLHLSTIKQIRQIINNKKRNTAANDLFVIIKPSKASVYKEVLNVLDEMTINDIKRYALVDISNEEEEIVSVDSK